jgi:hypothetical protein
VRAQIDFGGLVFNLFTLYGPYQREFLFWQRCRIIKAMLDAIQSKDDAPEPDGRAKAFAGGMQALLAIHGEKDPETQSYRMILAMETEVAIIRAELVAQIGPPAPEFAQSRL